MNIKYNTKAVVTIPGWAEAYNNGTFGGQRDTITSAALAYAYVPLVARAVQLRASSLANAPIYFYKQNDEKADWPFPDVDLRDLVWKSEAALLLDGANFIEKLKRQRSKTVASLKWVNPTTMNDPKAVKEDGLETIVFSQKGNTSGKWTLEDMIYMREFSLRDDVGKGESAAKISLNDAALIRYMGRFAARFFETGAMPVTVLQIDGIVDQDEAKRIEGFFKRQATRIRNAWNVLALGRAIEPKVISQPLKDLVMPDLNNQARHAVSLAFGIPQTMLEDAANFATSQEHRLSFWQETVQPRGQWMAEQFNRQLLAPMGLRMEFAFEEMDVFQEDENKKGATLNLIVTAVTTNPAAAAWAMDVLGYDLTDEQKQQLEAIVNTPKPEPEPVQETRPAEPVQEQPQKAIWADDLSRWERKALRVLKESGSAVCEYVSDVLPGEIRTKIESGLPECKAAEKVRELFDMQPVSPVSHTPAPQYRSDDIRALADALNNFAAKAVTATPAPLQAPTVNVTLPPITMTANLPEQPAPSVTFSPTIEAKAPDFQPPQVVVNVPEQPAPVVNVQMPEQDAPTVTVNIPEQPAPVNNITVQPADVVLPPMPTEATITTDAKGKRTLKVKK